MDKAMLTQQVKNILEASLKHTVQVDSDGIFNIDVNSTRVEISFVKLKDTLFVRLKSLVAFNSQSHILLESDTPFTIYEWCNELNSKLYQAAFIHFPEHGHPKIENMTIIQYDLLAEGLNPDALMTSFSLLARTAEHFSLDLIKKFGGLNFEQAERTMFN